MVHSEFGTVLQIDAAPRYTVRLLTAAPEDTRHWPPLLAPGRYAYSKYLM